MPNRRERLTPDKLEARREERHQTRIAQTYKRFLRDLEEATSLSGEQAEQAALAVVSTLERRIVPDEARHLLAQLPYKFKVRLSELPLGEGWPSRKLGREGFFAYVGEQVDLAPDQLDEVVRGVFEVLARCLTQGEVIKVVHGLPEDLRSLWPGDIQAEVEARHRREREAGRSARVRSGARASPRRASARLSPREEMSSLYQRILALPPAAQLGLLRTLSARVLGELDEEARDGFLRDLLEQINASRSGRMGYGEQADEAPHLIH